LVLSPKFAVAGIAIHKTLLDLRGMLKTIRASSDTAESRLTKRSDGQPKANLALDERDDHTPCASYENMVFSSLAA
jgi:hypothetical protein